jgi:ribosome maturation factor RimP
MAGGRHAELLAGLRSLASRLAEESGVELVELTLKGSSRRRLLRVDIDRAGPQGVDLDDCKRVSEALGAALEDEGLIRDSYVLEVSSPGADRPIVSADDIRRNTGRPVVVTTREAVEGRRTFRGRLCGERNGSLLLAGEDLEEITIPLEKIEAARQEIGFERQESGSPAHGVRNDSVL